VVKKSSGLFFVGRWGCEEEKECSDLDILSVRGGRWGESSQAGCGKKGGDGSERAKP